MEQVWDNISVGEFVEIRAILEDESRSFDEKQIALAAVVAGLTEDELLDMPLEEARPAFAKAGGLESLPKRSRIRQIYRIGRWVLRATEAKDMTVAQWVDFQTYGRDMEHNIVNVLSVALVPAGKTYNTDYDIEELKRDISAKMMIPDALAVCFFFQKRWLKSMQRSLNYLVGWTTLKGWTEQKKKALATRAEVSRMLRSL